MLASTFHGIAFLVILLTVPSVKRWNEEPVFG
jgi:hypothetical protein